MATKTKSRSQNHPAFESPQEFDQKIQTVVDEAIQGGAPPGGVAYQLLNAVDNAAQRNDFDISDQLDQVRSQLITLHQQEQSTASD